MNIAIFTDTFLPQINGVVSATVMLAEELSRQGHQVHVLAPDFKEYKQDKDLPFIVKRFPAIPARFYEDFKMVMGPNPLLLAYIVKHRFHIIHFQTPIALGLQAIITARLLKKPLVGTFHTFFADPDYLRHVKLDKRFFERLGWIYSNMYYNRCDIVSVPSQETGNELKTHGCRAPIRYISNGINLRQFDNSRSSQIAKEYQLEPGNRVFLFIGRLAWEKNLGPLIKAFCLAAKKHPEYRLLIVGGGPQEEEYKALAQKEDNTSCITFLGRIEHHELVKSGIFGVAEFFITLSKTENQPVTILEAQANGLIPVCLPIKGLKTMIDHEKTGYFLDSDEPKNVCQGLEKLLDNASLIKSIQQHLQELISKQSISLIAAEWERLYHELILKKTSTGRLAFLWAKLIHAFKAKDSIEKRLSFSEEEKYDQAHETDQ